MGIFAGNPMFTCVSQRGMSSILCASERERARMVLKQYRVEFFVVMLGSISLFTVLA